MSPRKQGQEKNLGFWKELEPGPGTSKISPPPPTKPSLTFISLFTPAFSSLQSRFICSFATWTSHSPWVDSFSRNASCPHVSPVRVPHQRGHRAHHHSRNSVLSREKPEIHPMSLMSSQEGPGRGYPAHCLACFKSLLCPQSSPAAANQGCFSFCLHPKHIRRFAPRLPLLTPGPLQPGCSISQSFVSGDINFLPASPTTECEFSAPPIPPRQSASKDSPDTGTYKIPIQPPLSLIPDSESQREKIWLVHLMSHAHTPGPISARQRRHCLCGRKNLIGQFLEHVAL